MADVGEDRRDLDAPRARLRALIEATPWLDWLLLTKRPDAIVRLMGWPGEWPRNVWAGTTVESQKYADERIPHLRRVPAAVRFLSMEPLLGATVPDLDGIGWAIIGGESGPGARPFDLAWARSLVRQCREADVAVFVKQLGARPVDSVIRWLDPEGMALGTISDRKGGDTAEWPEDLRVREFPAGATR